MKPKVTMITRILEPSKDNEEIIRLASMRHIKTVYGEDDYNIEIYKHNDGSVCIANMETDDFMYLYPEQIKDLRRVLNYRNVKAVADGK